jgi:hypothetical protein
VTIHRPAADVGRTAAPPSGGGPRWRAALTPAVPLARVAVLRVAVYLFVVADIFLFVNDVVPHAQGDAGLYRPLLIRRLLDLPAPSPGYAQVLQVAIIAGCLVAATGRVPRLAGFVVAVAFLDWVSIGMSYSKVDHDHLALVVATWVLPTVGAARLRDRTRSEAAGWALLAIQLAVVATYFLSAVAKIRFGGWGWANGSIFAWAMTRRGTPLGRALLDPPWILWAGQWGVLLIEALSPLLVVLRHRWRYLLVAAFAMFHAATFAMLTIHFLPLVVCLLSFLPLERLVPGAQRAGTPGQRSSDS